MKHHRSRMWNTARRLLASLTVLVLVSASMRADAGSVSFSWNAPTTNEDGTPLVDLAGYRVYLGTSPPSCPGASYFAIGSPSPTPRLGDVLSSSVASLVAGAMYFVAVTAID